eukprot:6763625-Alexandrium_andersonii.AAC.1
MAKIRPPRVPRHAPLVVRRVVSLMESQVPWCVCRTADIRAGGTRSSSDAVGPNKASSAKALSLGGREGERSQRRLA